MTDVPKIGFLCAGKNALELSVSIHCAYKIMEELEKYGFKNGGLSTVITDGALEKKTAYTAAAIERLCCCTDLVLTVGCDGFKSLDILPDVTENLCTGKAAYFESILSGNRKIPYPKNFDEKNKVRIFPDEDTYVPQKQKLEKADRNTVRNRIENALLSLAASFSESMEKVIRTELERERKYAQRRTAVKFENRYPKPFEEKYISLPPSRATAGIYGKTLVLNFSNYICTSVPLASAIAPAVNFAVFNLTGKSAADALSAEKNITSSLNCDDCFNLKGTVNK